MIYNKNENLKSKIVNLKNIFGTIDIIAVLT